MSAWHRIGNVSDICPYSHWRRWRGGHYVSVHPGGHYVSVHPGGALCFGTSSRVGFGSWAECKEVQEAKGEINPDKIARHLSPLSPIRAIQLRTHENWKQAPSKKCLYVCTLWERETDGFIQKANCPVCSFLHLRKKILRLRRNVICQTAITSCTGFLKRKGIHTS
jgi:hypothetical protein